MHMNLVVYMMNEVISNAFTWMRRVSKKIVMTEHSIYTELPSQG